MAVDRRDGSVTKVNLTNVDGWKVCGVSPPRSEAEYRSC